LKNLFT